MKIVICWSSIAGYWGACWRELQRQEGVDLFVLAFAPRDNAKFDAGIMEGLDYRLLDEGERKDNALVKKLVYEQKPDALIIVGWFVRPYRVLAQDPALAKVKKFMSVDTPWRNALQYVTRLRYSQYLRALDGAGVSGERSWQYVRRLGFESARIRRNMYSVDDAELTKIYKSRQQENWPRNFLFVGDYEHWKGIDVLVAAYQIYRGRVESPWTLTCCGNGHLKHLLADVEGVIDHGFVQPAYMPAVWLSAGVFVLPSRRDAWPLVIVEAGISGLPVIASDACGSAVEVLRHRYNGLFLPPDDVEQLAKAMIDCHECNLFEMGTNARKCAEGFGTGMWAERWLDAIENVSK